MTSSGSMPLSLATDEWLALTVTEEQAGLRVDRFLTSALPGVGRKLAASLCDDGSVRIEGRRVKKSELLRGRARVEVRVSAWGEARPEPDLPIDVVLERSDLVIVQKAPGMPTGALIGSESGTLAGALIARYPEMKSVGYAPREPGVVHRLDNFTSGLVIAARNQQTFDLLVAALSAGKIEKRYLAVVAAGILDDEGTIDQPLQTRAADRRRVEVSPAGGGYPCQTQFRVLKRGLKTDLVEVTAHAAFRHQIRAHLASLGAPLVGDATYDGPPSVLTPRHALHANYIACAVAGVAPFEATSKLPDELEALLE